MIIKIPLRISFIGGGTDFPHYFERETGLSVSTTFNQYAYITDDVEKWQGINNHKDLIQAAQTFYSSDKPLKVASDMPPGSGLGTSSAICVGLSKMLAPYWRSYDSEYLAQSAIEIERNIADIPGGYQDQYTAAYPGTNKFIWRKDKVYIEPIKLNYNLQQHLLLVNTKVTRRQNELMNNQISSTINQDNDKALNAIKIQANQFIKALKDKDISELGWILYRSWQEKKKLAQGINIPELEEFEDKVWKKIKSVYGFKLMGAGGGGYILVICKNRYDTAIELATLGYESYKPALVDSGQVIIP